jgi:uncharacterized protein YbjT (DUF2867 family)
MSKLLVLGGTGFVGRSLCERWLEQSGGAAQIVVPTRRPDRGRALQLLPGVEVVQADVHDLAQLRKLVAGCERVVNLIAILHGQATDFEGVHVDLSRKVIGVCEAAGSVLRVVHVSALGASVQASSLYLRSKARSEALWLASSLDVSVLQPSVIFGAQDRFMNLFAQLQAVLPILPLAGAQAQFQPVWVEDVAQAIVTSLLDQGVREPVAAPRKGDTRPQQERMAVCPDRIVECAGPRIYTLAELVRLAGQWSGHARPVLSLPTFLAHFQALFMELLPGEPLMSRDNLASMRTPNVATGQHPGLQSLGIEPTALESVAPLYLSQTTGPDRLMPLRALR